MNSRADEIAEKGKGKQTFTCTCKFTLTGPTSSPTLYIVGTGGELGRPSLKGTANGSLVVGWAPCGPAINLLATLLFFNGSEEKMRAIRDVPGGPRPVGAYSPAIVSGNLVFCAGQIGLHPESGALVGDELEGQARQVLANLRAVLTAAGSSPDKIVMTTVFLCNMTDAARVNQIYTEFVNQASPPARQTVAVKELPMGALIEISVIAEV